MRTSAPYCKQPTDGVLRLNVSSSTAGITELTRLRFAENAWHIETYHRGIKQFCGIEKSQARLPRTQRNHIGLVLRAFLRLEVYCFKASPDSRPNMRLFAVLLLPIWLIPCIPYLIQLRNFYTYRILSK